MNILLIVALTAQPAPVRRAAPPAEFPKSVASVFMENAFESLKGQRPESPKEEPKETETAQKDEIRGNGDFDRGDMMVKLETAEASIAEGLSDEKTFRAATHKINGGADIVIMMGKTLFSNDPEHGMDDDYLKFAEEMTIAAKQLKVLAQKGNYDGATRAFGTIRKNCNDCHGKFRL
jgi:cytochrome c556